MLPVALASEQKAPPTTPDMSAFFFWMAFWEKEIAESQEVCTFVEPPVVQFVQPIRRLDGLNRERHDEIVEKQIDREL